MGTWCSALLVVRLIGYSRRAVGAHHHDVENRVRTSKILCCGIDTRIQSGLSPRSCTIGSPYQNDRECGAHLEGEVRWHVGASLRFLL